MTGLRPLASRASWVLADQAVSSLSNAAVAILAARAVDAESFGSFAIAFAVFSMFITTSRAWATAPLNILYSAERPGRYAALTGAAAGTSVVIGICVGVPVALVALTQSGSTRSSLLAISAGLPLLYCQDLWRSSLITQGRPRAALANDTIWSVLAVASMAALPAIGLTQAWHYLAVWAGTAGVAAAFGCRQMGVLPRLSRSPAWIRRHRPLSAVLSVEWLATLGASQGGIVLLAVVASTRDVGAVKGAMTLVGPLNILGFGVVAFAVPEISRRAHASRATVTRAAAVACLGLVVAAAGFGAVLLALPSQWGHAALGATWDQSRGVLVWALAAQIANFGTLGPFIVLQARGLVRATLRLNLLLAPLVVAGVVGGGAVGGAEGALVGLTAVQAAVVPLWWRRLLHGSLEARGPRGHESTPDGLTV